MQCELPKKLDLLWAFVKQHITARTLVFVSTCKQVSGSGSSVVDSMQKLRVLCINSSPICLQSC